jgi:hypothetical protein
MSDEDTWLPPENEDPQEELMRLAREAVESQTGTVDMAAARRRCQRVIDLYAQGSFADARDYFHAAWVLLCGETPGHYSLARTFARQSSDLGEERAWTLRAMAWDRWLVASGKPQRFGTQMIKQGGRWSLGDVDTATTDFDRALYAVPPLYVQEQRAEQLQRQEEEE